jgi:hypothetical protein
MLHEGGSPHPIENELQSPEGNSVGGLLSMREDTEQEPALWDRVS